MMSAQSEIELGKPVANMMLHIHAVTGKHLGLVVTVTMRVETMETSLLLDLEALVLGFTPTGPAQITVGMES